jgi:YfiH family protein
MSPQGRRKTKPPVRLRQAPNLWRYRWLAHGFSTRQPGRFDLSYSTGAASEVAANRRALLWALGGDTRAGRWQLITLRQRHTDVIRGVQRVGDGRNRPAGDARERDGALKLAGDALVTNQPGLLLAVQVADCLPILLVDPQQRVVAAVHAGWRGTARRIAEKAVGRMRLEFGCEPGNLRAAIGPGIHRCCYEVGPEVAETFESQFPYAGRLIRRVKPSPSEVHWQQPVYAATPGQERRPRPGVTSPQSERFFLDLVEANRRQLRAAGVNAGHIWVSELCTACRPDLFFSHRAEQGHTGRMMGLIGLASKTRGRGS